MKLRPLGDRIVLKYQEAEEEKTQAGIILPDSAKEKPQTAVVVAVGPGSGKEDEEKPQTLIKEGDRVLFSKYAGPDVKVDEEAYTVVTMKDIIAVIE
ncbi:MAG: co-chaperone GroES [Clostridiales bacterium]|nr:co-chaperone GroES [Clostridiales bacterium]